MRVRGSRRAAALVAGIALLGLAQAPQAESLDLSALQWRNIGPAVTGGRIVDFAVMESDPDTFWAATASSGVWKTVNGGTTWTPQFDDQERVAVGGIAVAPGNPNVLWVGTGEPNARNLRSSSWGDGVYRSRDGGDSWEHMGLEGSQQIGRVVIDPRDEDVVYVSVLGSMWHDAPEKGAVRGLWRTLDGGREWSKVLDAGPRAGVVEVAQDPTRPDRLYAAAWERERTDWSFVGRGPDSGIFASRDGGDSWERLDNGLPEVDLGRIGLSVCRSAPDVVYAVIDAAAPHGGLYRSDDGGASWEHRSQEVGASMYYGQVRCDPVDPQRVYVLQTRMSISDDGGRTFSTEIPDASVHVDHHALWIDPDDPERLLLGNDGGVYQSADRGRTWSFAANLPITQFYTVAVDRRSPFYRVYGGTQDNNSLGGPSATRNRSGIVNSDWYVTVGGDGFFLEIDPDDPDVVYTEWQYGNLVRFDATTGERKSIQPQPPAGESFRWNWSAPVLLSRHDDRALYFGAQYVFRSHDRGDSWERISPDLTRALEIDEEARISDYGTIRIIAESPLDPELLAVGTDDGLLQLSEDGGRTWRAAEAFPGVPDTWQVVRVVLSAHAPDRVYVVVSGHEWDDFRPYVLRSDDRGRSWERLDSDLPPDEPIRAFAEHPGHPHLLWAGTEFGVWATLDGGLSWRSMRANLPTVAVHDLLVHPDTHDVVLGTHGRGFWLLDGTDSLVALAERAGVAPEQATLLGVRSGIRLVGFDRGKRNQGDAFYRAPNPPEGVLFDVWLPAGESAMIAIGGEESGFTRSIDVPGNPDSGLRRVEWDLRTAPLYRSPGDGYGETVAGPRVLAGSYPARLIVDGAAVAERRVQVQADPDLSISAPDRRLQFETALRAGRRFGRAQAASGVLRRLREDLTPAVERLRDSAGLTELSGRAGELSARAEALAARLSGGGDPSVRPVLPLLGRIYRQVEGSPSRPTAYEVEVLAESEILLEEIVRELNVLIREFETLAGELDAAGVEWTPGRPLRDSGTDGER